MKSFVVAPCPMSEMYTPAKNAMAPNSPRHAKAGYQQELHPDEREADGDQYYPFPSR